MPTVSSNTIPSLNQQIRAFSVERAREPSRSTIHFAAPGVAITLRAPHCKFGTQYAEFVGHVGDGRHILVAKLISGWASSRWTKPLKVPFADVLAVHDHAARAEG